MLEGASVLYKVMVVLGVIGVIIAVAGVTMLGIVIGLGKHHHDRQMRKEDR